MAEVVKDDRALPRIPSCSSGPTPWWPSMGRSWESPPGEAGSGSDAGGAFRQNASGVYRRDADPASKRRAGSILPGEQDVFRGDGRLLLSADGARRSVSYIATGEPMDKAGAYGIQGKAAIFVKGDPGGLQQCGGASHRTALSGAEKLE